MRNSAYKHGKKEEVLRRRLPKWPGAARTNTLRFPKALFVQVYHLITLEPFPNGINQIPEVFLHSVSIYRVQ